MTKIISKQLIKLTKEDKKQFQKELLSSVLENEKMVNVYAITYLSRGLTIAGYIVEPKIKKGNLPTIIWNRGGTRDFGAITLATCYLGIARLAKQGYIIFASQYSGGPGSEGTDDWGGENIEDVLILKKIIKNWPHSDIKRIGMIGWSRGGMMTYLALSKVKWIKAAVVGAAPTNEVNAPQFRKGWREHQISLYGKSRKEQIKRSVFYWPEKIYKKAPILIMHGTADWRVNVKDSIIISEKLYEQKVPHRLKIYEGGDHGLTEFKDDVDREIAEWFERFLKNKEKLPNLKFHGK